MIEVWCIQDLMDPGENSSLTWEKARVLSRCVRGNDTASLVIAFGTAASPSGLGQNGNVVMGTSVFVHDPYQIPKDAKKHWADARLNTVVRSDFEARFEKLPGAFVKEAEKRFLTPPNAPAAPARIYAKTELVSVGVVNVTDSADYAWTDGQALAKFREVTGSGVTESLETTHGVIRLVLDAPFMYVSGIANGVGMFQAHVGANQYSQNFVAAHNGAIALAWVLPELAELFRIK